MTSQPRRIASRMSSLPFGNERIPSCGNAMSWSSTKTSPSTRMSTSGTSAPAVGWTRAFRTSNPVVDLLPTADSTAWRPARWAVTVPSMSDDPLLRRASDLAAKYLADVDERPVAVAIEPEAMRARLGGPLPENGEAPEAVLEWLARAADPGLVGSAGPRYFGFVMGGAQPAALAADWLTSTWD